MLPTAVVWALRLSPLELLAACGTYVHFRGREKLKVKRQITDHSTFTSPYNCLVYLFSKVPNKAVLDLDGFPELAPLKEHWQTIREEAMRLYESGHIRKAEKYNDLAFNTFFKRGWKRFYLKWYGDFLPSAKELCPKTVELVQSIPTVNAALFTMMAPHSKLGAHRDPFAGSVRYHLGLKTPNSDQCRIYIDGDPYAWRDGEAILFDETFIHRVNNDTDDVRIILFCDVTRPLRQPMRSINQFMINHVVKLTQTQNTSDEHVGLLNHISRYIYAVKEVSEAMKKANKRLYKLVKYGLAIAILGLIAFLVFRHGAGSIARAES